MIPSQVCHKLWGGRFADEVDREFHILNASIALDKRLYAEDIRGSVAYASALRRASLLSEDEAEAIKRGLLKVKEEWDDGRFILKAEDEDIHSANERRLLELIGPCAKKLHTGRSRNDQVITDMKLWLRGSLDLMAGRVKKFAETLVRRAEREADVIMPGYTHLQRAQPVKWSQWLLSYAWYAKADLERLQDIRRRMNTLPLGSGAIAGNPFDIDRTFLARELGFEDVTGNSMYAVGDRDFVVEFLFWSSLAGIHLSRICEDLIIYSTEEFGFVTLAEAFSTGSSLMPQKRNPDSVELIRGKAGTLLGKCVGFMATLKGLPSTYNKDLQEDKDALLAAYDMLNGMFLVVERVLDTLKLNEKRCKDALTPNMLATDMAYYLVRKGIAFREAHHLAGRVVAFSEQKGVPVWDLTLEQLRTISESFEDDVMDIWNFPNSVEQYKVTGGTSSSALQEQLDKLKVWLQGLE